MSRIFFTEDRFSLDLWRTSFFHVFLLPAAIISDPICNPIGPIGLFNRCKPARKKWAGHVLRRDDVNIAKAALD